MEKNTPLTEALFYILLSVRKPNHGGEADGRPGVIGTGNPLRRDSDNDGKGMDQDIQRGDRFPEKERIYHHRPGKNGFCRGNKASVRAPAQRTAYVEACGREPGRA